MDTRQLAAFCEVVERRSFSQAAERLGVTQPAVSLQIRALEEKLGNTLLDRSGRRVEPTEAGQRLYRRAQRLLEAEAQLLNDLCEESDGTLRGALEIGASTGPGSQLVPLLLCDFQEVHPELRVSLSISDTQAVIEQVADRRIELGVVGARRRHRSLRFEPLVRDVIVLVVPPNHHFVGREITVDELRAEKLILMQEGAGVRQVIEAEFRKAGLKLRDFAPRLELGLQESVKTSVAAGHGVSFISRSALGEELAAGTLAEATVKGLDPARDIFVVSATGRVRSRPADAFLSFAHERLAA